jgi:hypothetical protein
VRITKEKQILTLFVLQCSLSSASEFHSKKDSHRECSVQHRQLRRQSMMGGTKWLLDNLQDPVQLEKRPYSRSTSAEKQTSISLCYLAKLTGIYKKT